MKEVIKLIVLLVVTLTWIFHFWVVINAQKYI